jgi:hypothetical protein
MLHYITSSPCEHASCNQKSFPEFLLLFSYNHLLFKPKFAPFVPDGVGVGGASEIVLLDAPNPSGLPEPYELLLEPLYPPPTAFCNKGLAPGEKGDPVTLPSLGLSLRPDGDSEYLSLLPGELLIGVGVLAYRGGVI